MSKQAIAYLDGYKHKYSKEALVDSLRQAGYSDTDIKDSVLEVYGVESAEPATDKAKNRSLMSPKLGQGHVYKTRTEKIVDYIAGLVFPWIVLWICILDGFDYIWLAAMVYIAALIFTKIKRQYAFRGLIMNAYILLALAGIVILFFLFGFGRYFF